MCASRMDLCACVFVMNASTNTITIQLLLERNMSYSILFSLARIDSSGKQGARFLQA